MAFNVLRVATLIDVFMGGILSFYQYKSHNSAQIFTHLTFTKHPMAQTTINFIVFPIQE